MESNDIYSTALTSSSSALAAPAGYTVNNGDSPRRTATGVRSASHLQWDPHSYDGETYKCQLDEVPECPNPPSRSFNRPLIETLIVSSEYLTRVTMGRKSVPTPAP